MKKEDTLDIMLFKHSIRLSEIKKVGYCTKFANNKLYTTTVLLPKTKFALRLENNKVLERDKTIYDVNTYLMI